MQLAAQPPCNGSPCLVRCGRSDEITHLIGNLSGLTRSAAFSLYSTRLVSQLYELAAAIHSRRALTSAHGIRQARDRALV